MSGYGMGYEMAKERQARMIHEATTARMALSSKRVQSLPSALRSLLMLVIPLN
jgi:hypothetical protein